MLIGLTTVATSTIGVVAGFIEVRGLASLIVLVGSLIFASPILKYYMVYFQLNYIGNHLLAVEFDKYAIADHSDHYVALSGEENIPKSARLYKFDISMNNSHIEKYYLLFRDETDIMLYRLSQ